MRWDDFRGHAVIMLPLVEKTIRLQSFRVTMTLNLNQHVRKKHQDDASINMFRKVTSIRRKWFKIAGHTRAGKYLHVISVRRSSFPGGRVSACWQCEAGK